MSDLLADARAEAEKLAGGAGKSVGAIQAMSTAVSTSSVSSYFGVGGVATLPSYAMPWCTLTVRFSLGGF